MKKIILTIILVPLMGCAWFQTTGEPFLKMAFGNAIRSLEGTVTPDKVNKVPAMLEALAAGWLPKNGYSQFVQGITASFIAAHPVTQDQINKVLETLATAVQTPALAPVHP